MATITIKVKDRWGISEGHCSLWGDYFDENTFRGIGKITQFTYGVGVAVLTIPRMSETRFENVVKRVLTKNLTEQGITPLSIEYSE